MLDIIIVPQNWMLNDHIDLNTLHIRHLKKFDFWFYGETHLS